MKWVWVCFAVVTGSAWAQGSLSLKQVDALNALEDDFTTCAAYFQIAKTCAPSDATPEELQRMDRIIDHFNALALATGKTIGMTNDAMMSRLKLAIGAEAKLTHGNCVNFTSLVSRHADRCKRLGEDPKAVLQEYLAK